MSDTIQTLRLLLRRFRPDDAAAMHAILSDTAAMRCWSTPPHTALAETKAWVDGAIAGVAAGTSDDFVVTRDGAVISKAGLWEGSEIGFIFARSVWGEGIASEALRAVIARAFAIGMKEITADVDPRNARSVACLERLGFIRTGTAARTFCIAGEWSDSLYLALRPG